MSQDINQSAPDSRDVTTEPLVNGSGASPSAVLTGSLSEPAIRVQARKYQANGFALVIVRPNAKHTASKAWQNSNAKPEQFRAAGNIAFRPGAASGHIVDLDFDIEQARALFEAKTYLCKMLGILGLSVADENRCLREGPGGAYGGIPPTVFLHSRRLSRHRGMRKAFETLRLLSNEPRKGRAAGGPRNRPT